MGQLMETRFRLASCWFVCLFLLSAKCTNLSQTWLWFTITGCSAVTFALCALVTWHISHLCPADSHRFPYMLMQYLVYMLLSLKGRFVFSKFLKRARNVKATQCRLLMQLLKQNHATVYGIGNKFSSINCREDFVRIHPLTRYAHYEEYITSIREGKQNVLTSDPVVYLSTSSGTTGPNKIIPCTGHMKSHAAMYFGSLMYYFVDQKVQLNLQRAFVLSYKSPVISSMVCTLQRGPISSHMSRYMPFSVSPEDIFQIANEQSALYMHAVFAFQENEVGHIESLNSSLVYSFWRHVESNWKDICNDIEHGTVPIPLDADRDIVVTLQEQLKPNKTQADILRNEFAMGFRGIARRIWRNLFFARMQTTGTYANHAKILRDYYMEGVAQISQAHVASEGFMGFNMSSDPEDTTYTATIEYAFMEFIPSSHIDEESPATLFAEEVKLGEMYEVVLTTPMGLYRYRTGDVIKIVGFCHQCPIYEFCYRSGQILNVSWEKTPELTLYRAVQDAVSRLCDVMLVDYTATEACNLLQLQEDEENNNNCMKHYVLFVEINKIYENSVRHLTKQEKESFDTSLRTISELYNTLRGNESIGAMRVVQVVPGTFLALKNITIEQSQSQQYKMPRVTREATRLRLLMAKELKD